MATEQSEPRKIRGACIMVIACGIKFHPMQIFPHDTQQNKNLVTSLSIDSVPQGVVYNWCTKCSCFDLFFTNHGMISLFRHGVPRMYLKFLCKEMCSCTGDGTR